MRHIEQVINRVTGMVITNSARSLIVPAAHAVFEQVDYSGSKSDIEIGER